MHVANEKPVDEELERLLDQLPVGGIGRGGRR
jgi:hypothetical protein